MPIVGLTDRRRLPRLGKLHLGIRDPERGFPRAVPYFVCPPEVQAVYGEKPTALDVVIPTEDEEQYASTYWRAYSRTRGLIGRGDGASAKHLIDVTTKVVQVDEETGELIVVEGKLADHKSEQVEWVNVACLGRACPYVAAKQCKELMMLQVMLPKVLGLGVYQIDTGSYNSIVDIHSEIALIRSIFGQVSGIPLKLTLEPREVAPDGKKKNIYTMHLRAALTWEEATRYIGRPMLALLEPPADDKPPELLYPDLPDEGQPSPAPTHDPQPPAEKRGAPTPDQLRKSLVKRAMGTLGYKDQAAVLGTLGLQALGEINADPDQLRRAWNRLASAAGKPDQKVEE